MKIGELDVGYVAGVIVGSLLDMGFVESLIVVVIYLVLMHLWNTFCDRREERRIRRKMKEADRRQDGVRWDW